MQTWNSICEALKRARFIFMQAVRFTRGISFVERQARLKINSGLKILRVSLIISGKREYFHSSEMPETAFCAMKKSKDENTQQPY